LKLELRSAAVATLATLLASLSFTAPALAADPVVAAAGDIACRKTDTVTADKCRQQFTADLLGGVTRILPLGDLQYDTGLIGSSGAYGTTWGASGLKSITRPVIGNHESKSDYYDYFNGSGASDGPAGPRNSGWYSYDVGSWHLIALNSNCATAGDQVSCAAGSTQEQWLRDDLAANSGKCTLAYFHHARFSSGHDGDNLFMQPIWQALYDAQADVVLAAHSHNYERFAPMDSNGNRDTGRGVREFVVGTGGAFWTGISNIRPNSEVHQNDTYGVLKLTLHPASYDWDFVPEAGRSFTDSGSQNCHNASGGGGTTPTTGAGIFNEGGKKVLSYFADPSQANDVRVSLSGSTYTITDPAFPGMGDTDGAGGCTVSGSTATCPASGVSLIRVETRDRDDRVLVAAATDSVLLGGDGNDTLTSDGGKDQLEGSNGNDALDGGANDDLLDGGVGNDSMAGGAGGDTADYSTASSAVTVNLGITTPQATGGSGTETLTDIENVEGTPGNDNLTGSNASNVLNGYSGADTFNSRDSVWDTVNCGPGTDFATTDSMDTYSSDCNTVDNGVPPDTSITSAPPAKTDATNATFRFTATESPATFECSVDGGAWATCSSGANYSGFAPGPHTFAVRGLDQYKNADASPAVANWFVTAPPLASFGSAPAAPVTDDPVTFTSTSTPLGAGNQIATHEWDLDGNGTFEANTGANPVVSKSYAVPTSITVRLKVTDVNGKTATASNPLTVVQRPPAPPTPIKPAGPFSPIGKSDKTAPKVTASGPRSQRLARTLSVNLQCSEPCTINASATIKIGKTSSVVSSKAKRSLSAGVATKVKLKLSRKALRALRLALQRKRLYAKVAVSAADAAGNVGNARFNVRLKP
jgi:acid phosphatase type 7